MLLPRRRVNPRSRHPSMTVRYDASEFTIVRTLLSWKGTMLPLVFAKPGIWLLLLVHVIFLVCGNWLFLNPECHGHKVTASCSGLPTMDWKSIGVITGMLTFFLVFYGSQCFNRMQMFFGHCVGLGGTCMNWIALVRLHFPNDVRELHLNPCPSRARILVPPEIIRLLLLTTTHTAPLLAASQALERSAPHTCSDARPVLHTQRIGWRKPGH